MVYTPTRFFPRTCSSRIGMDKNLRSIFCCIFCAMHTKLSTVKFFDTCTVATKCNARGPYTRTHARTYVVGYALGQGQRRGFFGAAFNDVQRAARCLKISILWLQFLIFEAWCRGLGASVDFERVAAIFAKKIPRLQRRRGIYQGHGMGAVRTVRGYKTVPPRVLGGTQDDMCMRLCMRLTVRQSVFGMYTYQLQNKNPPLDTHREACTRRGTWLSMVTCEAISQLQT